MKKTYTKYKPSDFIILGRIAAWDEDIKKQEEINNIVKILLTKFNKTETLERLKNYLLGYKIGKLEFLLYKCEDNVYFNFKSHEFTKTIGNEIIKTPFKKGYESLKEEATEESKQILKMN